VSDQKLREAEREFRHEEVFLHRYRARLPIPLHLHKSDCRKCSGDGRPYKTVGPCTCQPCHEVSIEDGHAGRIANIAAYAGIDVAQQATGFWADTLKPGHGGQDVWYPHVGRLGDAAGQSPNFKTWAGGFDRILEKPFDEHNRLIEPLPPVVVDGVWQRTSKPCPACGANLCPCKTQGKAEVPFVQYVSVLCLWEASREAYTEWLKARYRKRQALLIPQGDSNRPQEMLDRVEDWLVCPCEDRWWAVHQLASVGLPAFAIALFQLLLRSDTAFVRGAAACARHQ
jgi:hypothetical protein